MAITEHICDIDELARHIEQETKRETRATVLGHIQRGGSPVAYDRIPPRAWAPTPSSCCCRATVPLRRYPERKMVHHDIIDAIENMKRPFKGDWLETAKNCTDTPLTARQKSLRSRGFYGSSRFTGNAALIFRKK